MKLVVEATSPDGETVTKYVEVNLNPRLLDQYSQETLDMKILQLICVDTDTEWEITDVRLPRETVGMDSEGRLSHNGSRTCGAV